MRVMLLIWLLLFSSISTFPQINFHSNDRCLTSFCFTEINNNLTNTIDQQFTFHELKIRNITSEQLYQWSASIDLIEQYEEYLISNQSNSIFYNCTSSRFGSQCQYEFVYLPSENLTLIEIIHQFYEIEYKPISLTCYTHLECDRGLKRLCIDWSDICDGFVHCLNDQIDEKYCWQMQINECNQDEYRCRNGQCISKRFFRDQENMYECLDRSDAFREIRSTIKDLSRLPTIHSEDISCTQHYQTGYTYFTSSCNPYIRNEILSQLILNDRPKRLSNICYSTFYCTFYSEKYFTQICQDICDKGKCKSIINETCPELILTPSVPIAFSHIYFGYFRITDIYNYQRYPELICLDENLCRYWKFNVTSIRFDNKTCFYIQDIPIQLENIGRDIRTLQRQLDAIQNQFQICNTIVSDDIHLCNSSYGYHCQNSSKCLSINHLCDRTIDCHLGDDEYCLLIDDKCSPIESNLLFKCPINGKCISLNRFGDQNCDCPYNDEQLCEDETSILCDPNNLNVCEQFAKRHYIQNSILFPTICDGFQELLPININGTNHTDESDCQLWMCNNTYTRCNGFWNCLNGVDEIGCNEYSIIKCPLDQHVCIKPQTFNFICLSIDKVNDGQIDCLGAIDEPNRCHHLTNYKENVRNFYCDSVNHTGCSELSMICDSNCINQNSDLFCQMSNLRKHRSYCSDASQLNASHFVKYFCSRPNGYQKEELVYFSLNQTGSQPRDEQHQTIEPTFLEKTFEYNFECHRGYPLRDHNQIVCLCSDSYYGNYCQYQNQRVSLTLQFQTYSDSRRTLFSIVIQLIDNSSQRIIHSSKQITFYYIKHCQTKFNFYLIYSTRPKQSNRTYSIHIDIYDKSTLEYRGSLFIPLKFPFLPVHRISYVLTIPHSNPSIIINCPEDLRCIYGQCVAYVESSNDQIFCQCHPGWYGNDCSIPYDCTCSSSQYCAGIEATNRSICICPLDRWGPRCYLRNTICQSSSCLNNGQCVLADDNLISDEKFFCICSKGFSGDRCEIEDAKIIVSFDENIQLSETMLVHFIEVQHHAPVRNGSTFQSIPLYQNEITIRWSRPFHIVFTELSDKIYYLIHVQKDYNRIKVIRKLITSSDRCGHMSEYLNNTIVNYYLIQRIKYYHLPCQKLISCFYDREHFCLCNDFGSQRIANCFEFDSILVQNCFQLSSCQNNGQCLQDDVHCPKTSRCVCRECFYGSLCQFSSSLFDLSLDGIVGSHIQPHRSLIFQPLIIRLSLSLVVIMVAIGFINSILSFIAFQSKETRRVGCGYYLFGSTITTFFTSIMLLLKFSILLSAQMSIITNRTFLNIQCYSFDYLLQVFLNMDRWLNGCIAIERAFNIIKGTQFNKKQSKQMAKYIIGFLIIMTSSSTVYDIIHRRLVDDDSNDEYKRIWCIVSYSSRLSYFNQIVHMFHFFIPFLMNIISSLIIIFLATKRRQTIQTDQAYYQIFVEQIHQHRHILIAPFILIILSLPRLIISFVAGCMQSKRNSWIYLIGYLISFIPPMLTFVIFVSPSKLYKQEFRKTLKQYQKQISCFQ